MSRFPNRPTDEPGCLFHVIILALCFGFIFLMNYCSKDEKADCEARGGVWLQREFACVSTPGGDQ